VRAVVSDESDVATDETGAWVFIVDQLNRPRSEGLVRFVAEACEIAAE
jgi:hypothetical protein